MSEYTYHTCHNNIFYAAFAYVWLHGAAYAHRPYIIVDYPGVIVSGCKTIAFARQYNMFRRLKQ